MRIRIILTQGGNRRRGQNQIPDSFELQEKNFHRSNCSGALRAPEGRQSETAATINHRAMRIAVSYASSNRARK